MTVTTRNLVICLFIGFIIIYLIVHLTIAVEESLEAPNACLSRTPRRPRSQSNLP